jgi:NAD(P)-dependent dehydrogenase (short-subunit alcohol dehydrogenase family)
MGRFSGRRAIVTGSSRGIGAATAERLAAEGADVMLTARTVDRHDHLAGSLNETLERCRRFGTNVQVVAADLTDPDDRLRVVPAAVEALGGPIDILVNNAAAAIYGSLLDYPQKRRRIMFEVNVFAPLDLMQQVLPSMIERNEGWIVNVSSATGRMIEGPPYASAGVAGTTGFYGASKAALNRMTNAMALEVAVHGVRVNTVEPRAAVMSEGAQALVGDIVRDDQIESMEAIVESIMALSDCRAERSGHVHVSLDLIDELGLTVMDLDGLAPYPGGQRVHRG